jgi:hypothetical protein
MGKAKQKPLKGEVKGSLLTVAHKTANAMYRLFPEYDEWYEIPDWLAVGIMVLDNRTGFELFIEHLPKRHLQNLFAHGYLVEDHIPDSKFRYDTTSKFAILARAKYSKIYVYPNAITKR